MPESGVTLVRGLFDYHRWANHTLFGVVADLGEDTARRELGQHWSFPTLKAMFAHLYAADFVWLRRFGGESPARLMGDAEFSTLADLRRRWDALEAEQRAFVDGLAAADLARIVEFRNTDGKAFRLPLGPLLQHVANHATHHRSEIAAMVTMISGSPPPTDLSVYLRKISGQ